MKCNLRKLQEKDAEYMLEWMHDEVVTSGLRKNFNNATLETCIKFINSCQDMKYDAHLAIVDNNDEYLGTVSLKNIHNKCAEFAIVIRQKAMGKGIAAEAMKQIIKFGFEELDIDEIFWCVVRADKRAVRFYEKNGYHRFNYSYDEMLNRGGEYNHVEYDMRDWFQVLK